MRATRLAVALAAMLAIVASPGIAHASTIIQPFRADSGDSCRYGATEGSLAWQYGTISPLPVIAVDVKGRLVDHPVPGEVFLCRDDGYFSIATFVAYSGTVQVDRQTRSVNNAVVAFEFRLGGNSITTRIDRVVVQVCRGPIYTLPPTYCGKAVEYRAPPTA